MSSNKNISGHLSAIISVIIWGTTFISTKVLLRTFTPVEILVCRFVIGFIALFLIQPKGVKNKTLGQEALFAAAGLCGVTLYFLFENIALTYTTASNVGVIVSTSPFFIALFSMLFFKGEKLTVQFFIGFIAAISGIALISFEGSKNFSINPMGDILALLSAMVWAFYSHITRKISKYGFTIIYSTRKIFSYGIIFMIPAMLLMPFDLRWEKFTQPVNVLNILYLGFGACALCFVIWNFALKRLGTFKTSVYIYMVPVITVITSVIVLNEKITSLSVCGIVLTLAGLFLSERPFKPKEEKPEKIQKI